MPKKKADQNEDKALKIFKKLSLLGFYHRRNYCTLLINGELAHDKWFTSVEEMYSFVVENEAFLKELHKKCLQDLQKQSS
jgi:hypothetical protein